MALYDGCEKQFGGAVDIFCNNAGINHLPGWRKCMDIDIVSTVVGGTVKRQFIYQVPFIQSCLFDWARAVDPLSFFADPDPAVFLNANPDPDPALNICKA